MQTDLVKANTINNRGNALQAMTMFTALVCMLIVRNSGPMQIQRRSLYTLV